MTKPIKKPSKYFFNQLFLFNPIDDRLLLSITYNLKNTNDDIVAKVSKLRNKSNKF